jgi:hypothetical protein
MVEASRHISTSSSRRLLQIQFMTNLSHICTQTDKAAEFEPCCSAQVQVWSCRVNIKAGHPSSNPGSHVSLHDAGMHVSCAFPEEALCRLAASAMLPGEGCSRHQHTFSQDHAGWPTDTVMKLGKGCLQHQQISWLIVQGGQPMKFFPPIQFEDAALTPIALCCLALVCGQVGTHERNARVSNLQPNTHTTLVHANTVAAVTVDSTFTSTHAHCTTERLQLNLTVPS